MSRYFWCDLPRHADAEIWRTAEIANKTRRHTNCPYGNNQKFSRLSAFFGTESLSSCVDCAPPSHSSLDATLWRALEACSAHVARVDRGRPCAMQSYAVGCVHRRRLLPRPPRPDPGRTFFTPVAFPNVSRSDGGVSGGPRGARLVGPERPELTRRDPHVPPKHPQERPERLTIGRERPMDGARRAPRCAPTRKLFPSRPTPRLSRTHPFSHALAESHRFPGVALPSPASDIAAFPAFAQGNIFRGMRPRATAALTPSASRRPTPVRPTAPLFHPLNLQTSRWKRVPRLTLAPAGRLEPEGAAACMSTPGASATR